MGQKINQLRRRKEARKNLSQLFEKSKNVVVVHYSCESFYDRPDGSSPRITSIAVRNLASGQTKSFSIHQIAEKGRKKFSDIASNYDELEKLMLKGFFEYAKTHLRSDWLHWNMRDNNYGFTALEHRAQVLGSPSVLIPEENRHDLSRMLISIYGVRYIGHPRLEKLMEKNNITHRDFLSGAGEAKAFEDGEYVKLHQSTLRKLDVLANIAERAENETLKTNASWWEMHGGSLAAGGEWLREHWLVSTISAIGTIGASGYKFWPLISSYLGLGN
jgi:hypothetical protein